MAKGRRRKAAKRTKTGQLSRHDRRGESAGMIIKKGEMVERPDGSGYEITRDIFHGDHILASDFRPFGGAPEPKAGDEPPRWLMKWFYDRGLIS